jgi:hypothetical protein
MPETTWPISRHPPGSSQAGPPDPVSISSKWFRHVISRSLTLAFLTHTGRAQRRAVSATLTTTTLDRSSLRWFATSPCRAIAEDHQPNRPAPPSPMQHRIKQSDLLHRASLLRFVFTRGPTTFHQPNRDAQTKGRSYHLCRRLRRLGPAAAIDPRRGKGEAWSEAWPRPRWLVIRGCRTAAYCPLLASACSLPASTPASRGCAWSPKDSSRLEQLDDESDHPGWTIRTRGLGCPTATVVTG